MKQANLLALFWEGFEPVQHIQVDPRTLRIRLQAKADHVPGCTCCGRQVTQVHDVHWRQVRERARAHKSHDVIRVKKQFTLDNPP